MCFWIVSPTDDLRKLANAMDFLCFNPPWNEHLESLSGGRVLDCRYGLGRLHPLMRSVVVANQDNLIVRYAKVDSNDRAVSAPP